MNERKAVLIIDDNEIDRKLICELLAENYKVYSAENGREGLAVLRKNLTDIHLVLLDIQMPVMNGFEFMDVVTSDEELKAIPIIALSGDTEAEEQCLEKGALDYLRKPIRPRQLEARIRNTISLTEAVALISKLEVDTLTGLGNRRTFFEQIERIEKNEDKSSRPIGLIFADINGLKRVNDIKGHAAGDEYIKKVVEIITNYFSPQQAFRIGGDEFAILSRDESENEFYEKIEQIKSCWTDKVSASMGYVWLNQAKKLDESINQADRLMYEDKNRFYRRKINNRRKARVGQNEEAISSAIRLSEYVPCGFFGYYAEGDEEIIFANEQIYHLFGCETEEEFRAHVGNSFRGMVHPDDLELVESGIGSQIHKDKDTDYVEYRIICKDERIKYVYDYGRFVHTESYGNVFLVMLTDAIPRR